MVEEREDVGEMGSVAAVGAGGDVGGVTRPRRLSHFVEPAPYQPPSDPILAGIDPPYQHVRFCVPGLLLLLAYCFRQRSTDLGIGVCGVIWVMWSTGDQAVVMGWRAVDTPTLARAHRRPAPPAPRPLLRALASVATAARGSRLVAALAPVLHPPHPPLPQSQLGCKRTRWVSLRRWRDPSGGHFVVPAHRPTAHRHVACSGELGAFTRNSALWRVPPLT